MRDLIISVLAVALLLGSWGIFDRYSEKKLEECTLQITQVVLPSVEGRQWKESLAGMDELSKEWNKYRKIAMFFLGTEKINEIDYTMAKAARYVMAEDLSNSSGELDALAIQLGYLGRNEKFSAANIF